MVRKRVTLGAGAASVLVCLLACKRGDSSDAGAAASASATAARKVVRCLTPFVPSSDGPMSCTEYSGVATAESANCGALGGVVGSEPCPLRRVWGSCLRTTAGGGEILTFSYRRKGPAQGGDITSDSEARATCTGGGQWTSANARSGPPATAP